MRGVAEQHICYFFSGVRSEGIVDGKHLSARQHGKGWKRRKIDKIRDLILFDCEVLLQYCRRRSRKTLLSCLINKRSLCDFHKPRQYFPT